MSSIASAVASPSEQVVGYDARDYRADFSELWPAPRRDQFLYRLDVKKVLSVDTRVWPAVLASMNFPLQYQAALQYLWANAQELRDALSQVGHATPLLPFRTVAITLVAEGAESIHPAASSLTGLVQPPQLEPQWRLLGYDVADAWLLSALTNCGFLPGHDDVDTLRRSWAPYLNEFHLFSDPAAASAFRKMSDQRLAQDHAPTFVYGLWLVRS